MLSSLLPLSSPVQWTNDIRRAVDEFGEDGSPCWQKRAGGAGQRMRWRCLQLGSLDGLAAIGILLGPAAGWRPPVQYAVTPLHYVFNYPALFPTVSTCLMGRPYTQLQSVCWYSLPEICRGCSLPFTSPWLSAPQASPGCACRCHALAPVPRWSPPPPQDMRNTTTLARVQSTYQRYIQTCGYKLQFNDWQTRIAGNASFTACPPSDNACVKGTYRVKGAGCR